MTTVQIMPGIIAGANKTCKKPAIDYTAPLYTLKGLEKREAAYHACLELVARIDEDLTRGVKHYRTRAGELLTTLDLVVVAILSDNLVEAA